MAVGVVGTPGSYNPQRTIASAVAGPVAPQAPAYTTDAWSTGLPVGPAPVGIQAAAGTTNYGQLAAWGLGALGAVKFVLPHLAGGWLKAGVVLGGALIGNFAWKKMETEVRADKAGSVGHVGTIAGGAVGGFMLGRAILGDNPAGWLAGVVAGGGAWLGHKLYATMNNP